MDTVLLDTDVFSYLMKNDTRGNAYRPYVKNKTVAISFITVGELYHWAEKRNWSLKNRQNLEDRIKAVVVVPYDAQLCRIYGKVRASLPAGVTVAANDLWIAACSVRHSIPLITNNRKHFEQIPNLNIISESPSKIQSPPQSGDLFKAPAEVGKSSKE
jgi:predicted nucleic acid-binding protein